MDQMRTSRCTFYYRLDWQTSCFVFRASFGSESRRTALSVRWLHHSRHRRRISLLGHSHILLQPCRTMALTQRRHTKRQLNTASCWRKRGRHFPRPATGIMQHHRTSRGHRHPRPAAFVTDAKPLWSRRPCPLVSACALYIFAYWAIDTSFIVQDRQTVSPFASKVSYREHKENHKESLFMKTPNKLFSDSASS